MKSKILISFSLIFACSGLHLGAGVKKIKSEDRFHDVIEKSPLVVACFYRNGKKERKDKPLREQIKKMKKMFGRLDDLKKYEAADVKFVRINLAKDRVEHFAEKFLIKDNPTFLLFEDGKPLVKKIGGYEKMTGFVSQFALQKFIDEHFDARIDEIVDAKKEALELQILENQRARSAAPYWGWGHSWGYPYGWRSHWRYPYGYYHGYPHAGFGFSVTL